LKSQKRGREGGGENETVVTLMGKWCLKDMRHGEGELGFVVQKLSQALQSH